MKLTEQRFMVCDLTVTDFINTDKQHIKMLFNRNAILSKENQPTMDIQMKHDSIQHKCGMNYLTANACMNGIFTNTLANKIIIKTCFNHSYFILIFQQDGYAKSQW